MMKYIRTAAVLFLLACMLTGCGCQHEWQEATCLTPKTCTLCQETQGEADGAHIPGDWEEKTDLVRAETERIRHCTVCGQMTDEQTEAVRSFIDSQMFVLTPREFMDRMAAQAAQRNLEFSYSFISDRQELRGMAEVNGEDVLLQFFRADTSSLGDREAESGKFWCVSISMVGKKEDFGSMIGADLCRVFFAACDPALDNAGLEELQERKDTCAMIAGGMTHPFGYHEKNGLLYEFGHVVFGTEEQDPYVENIQVYASDFR